jgi:hypothetical protein
MFEKIVKSNFHHSPRVIIDKYASFTIKKQYISINFVFFTNNYENSPKNGQKNGKNPENFSRNLDCHFTVRLFLSWIK